MGGALINGLAGEADILAADPNTATLKTLASKGVAVTNDNKEAASVGNIVVVAVKPWIVQSVLEDIKTVMDYNRQKIVVIAAGPTIAELNTWLSKDSGALPALFLAIPNTAIAVRSSMTFIVEANATVDDTECIKDLFGHLGEVMIIEESLLPAATALASCGIAYAMRYVRAATEGGVELGFRADTAKTIVLQTIAGAARLLQQSGNNPETEIDKVTTAGGITIKGLNEMEHAGFSSAVIRGLKASIKK